jgi:hypothetical protein
MRTRTASLFFRRRCRPALVRRRACSSRPVLEGLETRDLPGDALNGFFLAALTLSPSDPLGKVEGAVGALAVVQPAAPAPDDPPRTFNLQALAAPSLAGAAVPSSESEGAVATRPPGQGLADEKDATSFPPLPGWSGDPLGKDGLANIGD